MYLTTQASVLAIPRYPVVGLSIWYIWYIWKWRSISACCSRGTHFFH